MSQQLNFSSSDLIANQDELFAHFQVSQLVLCCILAIALPLELIGLIEYLWKTDVRYTATRTTLILRSTLFLNGVCGGVTVGLVTTIAFSQGLDLVPCQVLVKITGGFYFMAVMCAYTFLLEKAKLVGKFEVGDTNYQRLFKLTRLATAGMIPVSCGLMLSLTEGRLTPNGRCLQITPVWFPATFAVLNVFLSAALLYLFIYPIRKNSTLAGPDTRKMRRVYVTNAVISSVGVCLTFSLVMNYVVLHMVAEKTGNDAFYTYALLSLSWDVIVLASTTRLTTVIWLPEGLRCCCRKKQSSESNSMASRKKSLPNLARALFPSPTHQTAGIGEGGRFGRSNSNVAIVTPTRRF